MKATLESYHALLLRLLEHDCHKCPTLPCEVPKSLSHLTSEFFVLIPTVHLADARAAKDLPNLNNKLGMLTSSMLQS